MTDPDCKIELDGNTYFLWSSEESGAVMDVTDTHTVYTLLPDDAKEVYRLLQTAESHSEVQMSSGF
ncbi:hypothetical protein [Sporosarcina sp. Te-1]|uniref:hypothetical protein n=1 Tax=Sporosarcina sp. Te-1 TaxID=2818390 RepID=UPI001A9CDA02|nr:hypothetical protein [Sporosarcina sp. Te-1]QTD43148.1 hypothetical protein J3U78_10590 [Sporosarcina sp. Te-1]